MVAGMFEDAAMTQLPYAATTPLNIGKVGLKARDGDKVAAFYRDIIGLSDLGREAGAIVLGTGERSLLAIETDAQAKPDDPREAGLFHTAFLLPERADLARWLRFAIDRKITLEGASDHGVSEALYLSDPEGNGIEIYADRSPEHWVGENGEAVMKTVRLDADDLLASADGARWQGAPEGSVIGHVHLRVGDPVAAAAWWQEEMGLDLKARYGESAVFLSSGGYHHHIGANSWHSAGAGRRDPARTGLAYVEILSNEASEPETREDPWGTEVRVAPAG